jgi:hypothetical protein
MDDTKKEDIWREGDFGEGYNTYVYVYQKGFWYSVNGTKPIITDYRWIVTNAKVVVNLNKLSN